jgi:hypothetical protein
MLSAHAEHTIMTQIERDKARRRNKTKTGMKRSAARLA